MASREAELHIFCDASTQALAAVAYWRFYNNQSEKGTITFILGKSRVAPIKPKLSVPRMELQAAVLASRLSRTIAIERDIKIKRRVFWTDARVVLCWIKTDPWKHSQWLANRLGEIDELTNVSEWRWVPTKLNPADEATRDTGKVPKPDSRWMLGPSFLPEHESCWPKLDVSACDISEAEETHVVVTMIPQISLKESLPEVHRFSSWLRLIRTTASILLFINVYLRKEKAELTVGYIFRAEQLWLHAAQQENFGSEIKALKNGNPITKGSKLCRLTPFLDDNGTLRVRGRIVVADNIALETKILAILDGRHPYVRLLVFHYHCKASHGSPETVINELRQKYWIIHARPTVRSITANCQWCRVQRAQPCPPLMGDLPRARLAHHERPFNRCGVDYYGPMTITIGRRHEKRWGVLFTCLTTRAIHLEIAASFTTDGVIMALRRFAARRCSPAELWSDNGSNFHGAEAELKKSICELNKQQLRAEGTVRHIEWHFIPPYSPHMGGCWERLIRSVKVALKSTLRERAPKEEVLATLMIEAEHSVNSRPLTHVSVDPRDPESLTPNHFLIGSSSGLPILGHFDNTDLCRRKQWRTSQRLADMFWARWIKEYLPTLQPRKRWNKEEKPLAVADVVLIVDSTTTRNVWPRGLVTRIFPGLDGRVRVAEIRTGNRTCIRSVAKLIVLTTEEESTDSPDIRTGGENIADS